MGGVKRVGLQAGVVRLKIGKMWFSKLGLENRDAPAAESAQLCCT